MRLSLRPSIQFRGYEQSVDTSLAESYTLTFCDGRYELSGGKEIPPLRLLVHGDRAALTLDEKGAGSIPVRDGAEPRLCVGRLAVESRVFPCRPASRSRGHAGRVDRAVGSDPGAVAAGRGAGRTRAPPPAARDRRTGRRGSARRRAGARRRSVHHHARRPRRGSGARAGRRRGSPHGHRRLPLVHRLGPRHDDQPRGADADHAPLPRGGLHPADVRALRPRRPDPEHVPRRRARGALSHRRRDAVVLPRGAAVLRSDRRRRHGPPAHARAHRHRRRASAGHAVRHRRRSGRRPAAAGRAGLSADVDGREGRRLGRDAAARQGGRDQRALVQRAVPARRLGEAVRRSRRDLGLADHADRARESFNRRFWYAEGGYLYDVVDGERATIRRAGRIRCSPSRSTIRCSIRSAGSR